MATEPSFPLVARPRLFLAGPLTITNVRETHAKLGQLAGQGGALDCSAVTETHLAIVQLLLIWRAALHASGAELRIEDPSPALRTAFELGGFGDLLRARPVEVDAPPMSVAHADLLQTFLDEATDHVAGMEEALLEIEQRPEDGEALAKLFREAHSIKGAAGFFGLSALGDFTHLFEDVLSRARAGEVLADARFIELCLRAIDVVRDLLVAARQGTPKRAAADVESELAALRTLGPAAASTSPYESAPDLKRWKICFQPDPGLFILGLDPLLALRELAGMGQLQDVEPILSGLPELDAFDPERCYIGWRLQLVSSHDPSGIDEILGFYPGTYDVSAVTVKSAERPTVAPAHHRRAAEDPSSIRVATDKIDKLMDLAGELIVAQSIVSQLITGFTVDRLPQLELASLELQKRVRELQEQVTTVRMVPISRVFGKIPRMVHDLGRSLAKTVKVELSGIDTEIDKSVSEQLADPLLHLVRNALDHGIETPEERRVARKSECSTLRVSARQQGGMVIVEVADDGRGLDLARIRDRAVSMGLLAETDVPSSQALTDILFAAGFSTATQLTEVSGRGVGLDVVKRNVTALGGTIRVQSDVGIGTQFRIELPLTLSIIDGLFVGVGAETYVIPLASIVQSCAARPDDSLHIFGSQEVLPVAGKPLPLLRLGRLFGVAQGDCATSQELIVIVQHDDKRVGLVVDQLLGQSQVVLKNLDTTLRGVRGIGGATITPEGRVALVLDVPCLVNQLQLHRSTTPGRREGFHLMDKV